VPAPASASAADGGSAAENEVEVDVWGARFHPNKRGMEAVARMLEEHLEKSGLLAVERL
jgi:lysophospholipase L1-like esterase